MFIPGNDSYGSSQTRLQEDIPLETVPKITGGTNCLKRSDRVQSNGLSLQEPPGVNDEIPILGHDILGMDDLLYEHQKKKQEEQGDKNHSCPKTPDGNA